MKGDFTRQSYKHNKHYRGVLMQQGRVLLDTDFNEQTQTLLNQQAGLGNAVVGKSGALGNAFRIAMHEPIDDCESAVGWVPVAETVENEAHTPRIFVDHTVAWQGRGCLRLEYATAVKKPLLTPLTLRGRQAFYVAVYSYPQASQKPIQDHDRIPFPGGPPVIGPGPFEPPIIGPGPFEPPFIVPPFVLVLYKDYRADQKVSLTPTVLRKIGLWTLYRCTTTSLPATVDGIGFAGLDPQTIYRFDALEADFPALFRPVVDLPGVQLHPSRWQASGAVKGALAPVLNPERRYLGRSALSLVGRQLMQPLHSTQDWRHFEAIELTVPHDQKSTPTLILQVKAGDPIMLQPTKNQTREGDWKTLAFAIPNDERLAAVTSMGLEFAGNKSEFDLGAIHGLLRTTANFYILAGDPGKPGRLYLEGMLCEKDATETYYSQLTDYPGAPPLEPLASGQERVDLIYLDVWQRHVTALEDPALLEPALGGPDTTTRLQTISQVHALTGVAKFPPMADTTEQPLALADYPELNRQLHSLPRLSSGRLTTLDQRYTALENRLYRVEIHVGGKIGEAYFKWSDENAAIGATLLEDLSPKSAQVRIQMLGGAGATTFQPGNLLEISDDWTDLTPGAVGDLVMLGGDLDPNNDTLPIQALFQAGKWVTGGELSRDYTTVRHARVRRWRGIVQTDVAETQLGDGVGIQFRGEPLRANDYWTFAARSADQRVERIEAALPAGVEHHYCPLALIRWGGVDNGLTALEIADLRPTLAPLTELSAVDVAFDDRATPDDYWLQHQANVQGALEALSEEIAAGGKTCTVICADGDLQGAILRVKERGGGTIYIPSGTYVMPRAAVLDKCQNIIIEGSGATHLIWTGLEPLLTSRESNHLQIKDITLLATNGTVLDLVDSSALLIERSLLVHPVSVSNIDVPILGHIPSKKATMQCTALNGCTVRDSRIIGTIGVELTGHSQDLTFERSSIWADQVGIGAVSNASTGRLHLINTDVRGLSNELTQLLTAFVAGFDAAKAALAINGLLTALYTNADLDVWAKEAAINLLDVWAKEAAINLVGKQHIGLSIQGGTLAGEKGIILQNAQLGNLTGVSIHSKAFAIQTSGLEQMVVERCRLDRPWVANGTVKNLVVRECIFEIAALVKDFSAFDCNGLDELSGLSFQQNSIDYPGIGIRIQPKKGQDIWITENKIRGSTTGILYQIDAPAGVQQIANNLVNASDIGISVAGHGVDVLGNVLKPEEGAEQPVIGILIPYSAMFMYERIHLGANQIGPKWLSGIMVNCDTTSMRVEDNYIDCENAGFVSFRRIDGVQIIGNIFRNCVTGGISLEAESQDGHQLIADNDLSIAGVGINVTCSETKVARNNISTSANIGIVLSADRTAAVDNRIICTGTNGIGIRVYSSNPLESVMLTGNEIEGKWSKGVQVDCTIKKLRIEHNSIALGDNQAALSVQGLAQGAQDLSNTQTQITDNSFSSQSPVVAVGGQDDKGTPLYLGHILFSNNQIRSTDVAPLSDTVQLCGKRIVAIGNNVQDDVKDRGLFPLSTKEWHPGPSNRTDISKPINFGEDKILWWPPKKEEGGLHQSWFDTLTYDNTTATFLDSKSYSCKTNLVLSSDGQTYLRDNCILLWFKNGESCILEHQNQDSTELSATQLTEFFNHDVGELFPFGENRVLNWVEKNKKCEILEFKNNLFANVSSPSFQTDFKDSRFIYLANNHVLQWEPTSGKYKVWQFHPERGDDDKFTSISSQGQWTGIDGTHELVYLGNGCLLDWKPGNTYRILRTKISLRMLGSDSDACITALGNTTDFDLYPRQSSRNVQVANNVSTTDLNSLLYA